GAGQRAEAGPEAEGGRPECQAGRRARAAERQAAGPCRARRGAGGAAKKSRVAAGQTVPERGIVMETVREIGPRLGIAPTCSALGLPRAAYYRRLRPPKPRAPRPLPQQALSPVERPVVLAKLHEDRFIDVAPTEIYAQLLDEGQHLCSIRTMYRVLAANEEVRERRRQRLHVPYAKPELLATTPNQVWS